MCGLGFPVVDKCTELYTLPISGEKCIALKAGLTPVCSGVCEASGGGDVEYVFVVRSGGSCLWLARLELLIFGLNAGLGCVEVVAVVAVDSRLNSFCTI